MRSIERPRILVIEDDKLFLWTLNQFLVKEGYEVCPTGSGEAALDLAEHQSFDVVISDFHLPGMNGKEVIQKLKALQPRAKSVLISAYQIEEVGKEFPLNAYLNKPIDLGSLRKLLLDLTNNRSGRATL
ncbi:MAG: response regulator [Acidobacteriota bacterium]